MSPLIGSLHLNPARAVLNVSSEDIVSSVHEVMRREWESMREECSSLPQLQHDRAGKESQSVTGGYFTDEQYMDMDVSSL